MVQKLDTGHVYAMKILKKMEMVDKDQVSDSDNQPRTWPRLPT